MKLEQWLAVVTDASRAAEALAMALEDHDRRTGDLGREIAMFARFQVSRCPLSRQSDGPIAHQLYLSSVPFDCAHVLLLCLVSRCHNRYRAGQEDCLLY
jgi:hypothetical protein